MSKPSDRIVTVSNALSLFRAVITVPLIWALETDRLIAVMVMIVLAVISDFLDGFVARRAHEITNVGKMLDPIADKFIVMAVMIFLIFDPERRFPVFFFLLLGIRDITLANISTYIMNRRAEIHQSNQAGKWFLNFTTLAMILYILKFTNIGFLVLLVATVLLLVSWVQYMRCYFEYLHTLPDT